MLPKNLSIAFSIIISIALISQVSLVFPAQAVTYDFQWTGSTGYLVKGSFSFDETKAENTISERGSGKTDCLQSLIVSFYKPTGESIGTYENVVDGVAKGNYFEFNFDPVAEQFVGQIDLGGELLGETYLKGKMDRELPAIVVEEQLGKERIIDRVVALEIFSRVADEHNY
jgi:hypothetical protein